MGALLLVLASCAGATPAAVAIEPQSPEAEQLEAVIVAWNERADLPALPAARLRTMLVLDARTKAEYLRRCPPSGECLTHTGTGLVRPMEAIAVLSPAKRSPGSRLSLIRHAAVHRAAELAGMSDPVHRDPRLWPYHCGQDLACRAPTVEERARAIANGAP